MRAELQQIAIAKACWTDVEVWHDQLNGCFIRGKPITGRADNIKVLPDYLNDLNAMHEAEKVAFPSFRTTQDYYNKLCHVTQGMGCFQATAAQRAEAFLKTLNLWTT